MGQCSISTAYKYFILNIFLPWLLVVFFLVPDPMHFYCSVCTILQDRAQQTFCKGSDRKYLRLCQPSMPKPFSSAIVAQRQPETIQKLMCNCVTAKLHLEKQMVGEIWPAGCNLLIPDLGYIMLEIIYTKAFDK